MKKPLNKDLHASLSPISLGEFLTSYNQNMPATFPRASTASLLKFRETYPVLFKNGDMWSLDLHRKKFFEWLPRNS